MQKRDILELKKRFKKDYCTFSKMCGCYVNGEKNVLLKFRENFLNLEEDEYFKYLEIAKKTLSGTIGNNILSLEFPLNEDLVNEKQMFLMNLKNSKLMDDTMLDEFYNSIINSFDYEGNFLILLFNDSYDVLTKTNDNLKLDESEETYEYILCAICPVSLSTPGLRYFEEENSIKSRVRDWIVEMPVSGFVYPAFIDRSSNVNEVMYYTKNAKAPHPEIMEEVLGCGSKWTNTIKKQTFEAIVKDSFGSDEKMAEKVFMEVQDSLNTMVEEYNATYEDTDYEPITLTKEHIQNVLIESEVPKEVAMEIEKSCLESFALEAPLVEALLDSKVLKEKEQKRKEERLEKQVEVLKTRLQEVTTDLDESSPKEDDNLESSLEEVNYDVVLQVKPEKLPQIKSQLVDGKNCIVIPIEEDEMANINGLDDLI